MKSKTYQATFRLWDVTKGERTGELMDESGPHKLTPLSAINDNWAEWTAQSPVPLDPLNPQAIRVSMSRNAGESVTRRRFEHEGSKYLITVHVAPVPEVWECSFAGDDGLIFFKIEINGATVVAHLSGHAPEPMERVED